MGASLANRSSCLATAVTCTLALTPVAPASAYISAYSDTLMVNGVSTNLADCLPSSGAKNCETAFTIGSFDTIVLLTEKDPKLNGVIVNNGNGTWTVNDLSDAVWQKNGVVGFTSDPVDTPGVTRPPSATFKFDPTKVVVQETGREFFATPYLFPDTPNPPVVILQSDIDPPPAPAPNKQNAGASAGGSATFSAAAQTLTLAGDHIAGTPFAGDPAVGAAVNIPAFGLDGQLSDGNYLFESDVSQSVDISVGSNAFVTGQMQVLEYLTDSNMLLGAIADPFFSANGSPWVAALANLFDPSSPNFDPNLLLYFEFALDDNLLSLTRSFAADGSSPFSDLIFAADPAPVPEPHGLPLLAAGCIALVTARAMLQGRIAAIGG
jgi:hypothetical protein